MMGGKRIVIAVDGPAGSGKSSVSREAAKALGLRYIDSGAIYRAITWRLLEKYGTLDRSADYGGDLKELRIEQRFNPDGSTVTLVDGRDVSREIRSERIAASIGIVSDDPHIRGFVNGLLRSWSREESIIMDGRDIGSVVFPDADCKIYLDASVETRAIRRCGEYREMGKTVDVNEIKNQIMRRDAEDSSRPFGRLLKADEAVYIDTSHMTKDQVIQRIIRIAQSKMLEKE